LYIVPDSQHEVLQPLVGSTHTFETSCNDSNNREEVVRTGGGFKRGGMKERQGEEQAARTPSPPFSKPRPRLLLPHQNGGMAALHCKQQHLWAAPCCLLCQMTNVSLARHLGACCWRKQGVHIRTFQACDSVLHLYYRQEDSLPLPV
jgi:hypothetical protein